MYMISPLLSLLTNYSIIVIDERAQVYKLYPITFND